MQHHLHRDSSEAPVSYPPCTDSNKTVQLEKLHYSECNCAWGKREPVLPCEPWHWRDPPGIHKLTNVSLMSSKAIWCYGGDWLLARGHGSYSASDVPSAYHRTCNICNRGDSFTLTQAREAWKSWSFLAGEQGVIFIYPLLQSTTYYHGPLGQYWQTAGIRSSLLSVLFPCFFRAFSVAALSLACMFLEAGLPYFPFLMSAFGKSCILSFPLSSHTLIFTLGVVLPQL